MTGLREDRRERPLIMSAPMVRAILAGRKTQTRRIARRPTDHFHASYTYLHQEEGGFFWSDGRGGCRRDARLPFRVGDRLWVRETWQTHSIYEALPPRDVPPSKVFYAADGGYAPSNTRRRPSIFMPRWASRLTLIVESVRVERLQDISCADAIAEGIAPVVNSATIDCDTPDPRAAYRGLWNSIHGPDAWDANPWVAVIGFRAIHANIDTPARKDLSGQSVSLSPSQGQSANGGATKREPASPIHGASHD